jgi:hypothetical protein
MVVDGDVVKYVEWHNLLVGIESTVFRKHLMEFMAQFSIMTVEQKIERCKEILQQEKSRRNAKRANDKLKESKENKENILYTTNTPKPSKTFVIADVTGLMCPKPNLIEHSVDDFAIPKQWKTRDIFDFLTANQEHHYKAYCEANNNNITKEWTDMWSELLTIKGLPWEVAEPCIHAFVENLRRIRHNSLTKKDVLNRDDRQVWPAETVAKLFAEGRIHEYKAITEQYTGDNPDDPKWQKRWEQFVGSLESANSNRVGIIAKFMTAQRTKKYRRSK